MSDAPRQEPEEHPAVIVEEPLSRPQPPYPDDGWDGVDDDDDTPAATWPHPDRFWP
jgi:hypothetical protein